MHSQSSCIVIQIWPQLQRGSMWETVNAVIVVFECLMWVFFLCEFFSSATVAAVTNTTPSAAVQFVTAAENDGDLWKMLNFHGTLRMNQPQGILRRTVDKDAWHWEEYTVRVLVVNTALFKCSALCEFSLDESNVLVHEVVFPMYTLNEMTLGRK